MALVATARGDTRQHGMGLFRHVRLLAFTQLMTGLLVVKTLRNGTSAPNSAAALYNPLVDGGAPGRLSRSHVTLVALSALVFGSPTKAQTVTPDVRQRLEERTFLRSIEEQGGRSHASGDRPELGSTLLRTVALSPVRTIRVGFSPTSFGSDGSVLTEYATAAAHNHDRVEITATGDFELADVPSGAVIFSAAAGETLAFLKATGGVSASGPGGFSGLFRGPLRLRPSGENSILVVNSLRRINRLAPLVAGAFQMTPAPYRGNLEVFASDADPAKLRLVNVVDLEDYLAGALVCIRLESRSPSSNNAWLARSR